MASSSSPCILNYDVFLSFRGEDTRRTFVCHLHKALVTRAIVTFKDDRELEVGDSISDELRRAIKTSKFAIVVISKNYASSRWCLDELQLIMQLWMKKDIKVVPIFYGVEPSDVRHQRGSFALERYQGSEMMERVLEWRKALTLIANQSGEVSSQCKDEAKMIEDIVRRISSRLLSMLPVDFGYIVGMNAHLEGLKPLLDMDSKDEVRMIGIWGMGGIGKTTIAKYLYEQLKHQFSPHHCFIQNVRMTSAVHGLLYLQELLLSNIIGEVVEKLWSVEQGAQCIKSRLGNLKVLVVLDDVDDVKQLKALAEKARWFGPGSRIIITTRDKALFNPRDEKMIYNVKCLDNDNALQLFQHIAFDGGCLPVAYKDLSSRASELGHGLPLALEALGFYLRDKPIETWHSALKVFEGNASYEEISNILRVSYDSLNEVGKTAFLHVACLFNGDPVWRAMALIDSGEFGINLLAEKSLIDVSNDYIAMHAIVEKMGKRIVRQESNYRTSEQRILWDPDDIYTVVADNAGTSKSEAMVLHVCEMPYKIPIEWNFFKPMHNLNFLKIYKHCECSEFKRGHNLNQDLIVPRKLRLLHWDGYPFKTLPSNIRPECLVELSLCSSKLKTLWSGTPRFLNLKRLDMTGSKELKELPDLQEAVCLEELLLEGCISLKQIPASICSLYKMKKLDLSNCDGLKNMRIKITESQSTVSQNIYSKVCLHVRLISMNVLDAKPCVKVSHGISLTNLSIKGKVNIELEHLQGYADHLCFIAKQQTVDELMLEKQTSNYCFKSLDIMRLKWCKKSEPFRCCSFTDFPWLTELNLINLNIKKIPDDIHHLRILDKLDLSGNDFEVLPTTMNLLTKLKDLTLCNCRSLEALPELSQLERLTLSDCTKLQKLVNLDQESYSLVELWVDNCKNIQSLSDQLNLFKHLTYLDISRHDFETVPTSIKSLSSLVTLCLNHCKKLKSLKELPLGLKYIYAHGCMSLDAYSISIEHYVNHLYLSPCNWKHDPCNITRFPAGRRSEEVPLCACFEESTMPITNPVVRSSISFFLQRLKPWLWVFAVYILIFVGLYAILHVTRIDPSTGTRTMAFMFLNALIMFIFLYQIGFKKLQSSFRKYINAYGVCGYLRLQALTHILSLRKPNKMEHNE